MPPRGRRRIGALLAVWAAVASTSAVAEGPHIATGVSASIPVLSAGHLGHADAGDALSPRMLAVVSSTSTTTSVTVTIKGFLTDYESSNTDHTEVAHDNITGAGSGVLAQHLDPLSGKPTDPDRTWQYIGAAGVLLCLLLLPAGYLPHWFGCPQQLRALADWEPLQRECRPAAELVGQDVDPPPPPPPTQTTNGAGLLAIGGVLPALAGSPAAGMVAQPAGLAGQASSAAVSNVTEAWEECERWRLCLVHVCAVIDLAVLVVWLLDGSVVPFIGLALRALSPLVLVSLCAGAPRFLFVFGIKAPAPPLHQTVRIQRDGQGGIAGLQPVDTADALGAYPTALPASTTAESVATGVGAIFFAVLVTSLMHLSTMEHFTWGRDVVGIFWRGTGRLPHWNLIAAGSTLRLIASSGQLVGALQQGTALQAPAVGCLASAVGWFLWVVLPVLQQQEEALRVYIYGGTHHLAGMYRQLEGGAAQAEPLPWHSQNEKLTGGVFFRLASYQEELSRDSWRSRCPFVTYRRWKIELVNGGSVVLIASFPIAVPFLTGRGVKPSLLRNYYGLNWNIHRHLEATAFQMTTTPSTGTSHIAPTRIRFSSGSGLLARLRPKTFTVRGGNAEDRVDGDYCIAPDLRTGEEVWRKVVAVPVPGFYEALWDLQHPRYMHRTWRRDAWVITNDWSKADAEVTVYARTNTAGAHVPEGPWSAGALGGAAVHVQGQGDHGDRGWVPGFPDQQKCVTFEFGTAVTVSEICCAGGTLNGRWGHVEHLKIEFKRPRTEIWDTWKDEFRWEEGVVDPRDGTHPMDTSNLCQINVGHMEVAAVRLTVKDPDPRPLRMEVFGPCVAAHSIWGAGSPVRIWPAELPGLARQDGGDPAARVSLVRLRSARSTEPDIYQDTQEAAEEPHPGRRPPTAGTTQGDFYIGEYALVLVEGGPGSGRWFDCEIRGKLGAQYEVLLVGGETLEVNAELLQKKTGVNAMMLQKKTGVKANRPQEVVMAAIRRLSKSVSFSKEGKSEDRHDDGGASQMASDNGGPVDVHIPVDDVPRSSVVVRPRRRRSSQRGPGPGGMVFDRRATALLDADRARERLKERKKKERGQDGEGGRRGRRRPSVPKTSRPRPRVSHRERGGMRRSSQASIYRPDDAGSEAASEVWDNGAGGAAPAHREPTVARQDALHGAGGAAPANREPIIARQEEQSPRALPTAPAARRRSLVDMVSDTAGGFRRSINAIRGGKKQARANEVFQGPMPQV